LNIPIYFYRTEIDRDVPVITDIAFPQLVRCPPISRVSRVAV